MIRACPLLLFDILKQKNSSFLLAGRLFFNGLSPLNDDDENRHQEH